MENIGILLFVGLGILQIIMIVKFFQIASDVRSLRKKNEGDFESLPKLKQRVEIEKYLGHIDKVKEMLVVAKINTQNEYDKLKDNGEFSVRHLVPISEYIDNELQKNGVDPQDLLRSVIGDKNPDSSFNVKVEDLVVEKNTGEQWVVKGKFMNRLFCTKAGGLVEKEFFINEVLPFEEYRKQHPQ